MSKAEEFAKKEGFLAGPVHDTIVRAYEQALKDLKDEGIERTVKVDAGGYPYIDCNIELYDYTKDMQLAKKGDKVTVVILKDDL